MRPTEQGYSDSVASRVAEELAGWGTRRVHGLCGGHIQALWDAASRRGMDILDVRHEVSGIYAAHAEAIITNRLGVCLVTAGPGFTNALTAIVNAAKARAPVLVITGSPPLAQMGLGAMQEMLQADVVRPWVTFADTVYTSRSAIPLLRRAAAAALGADGTPGPAVLEIPTDVQAMPSAPVFPSASVRMGPDKVQPVPEALDEAAALIASASRPLVVGGHPVRSNPALVFEFLKQSKALYLDTAESRGALLPEPTSAVPALRARAMAEADLVITLGRRLDYQLAYGSRAVFNPRAKFLRIGRGVDQLFDAAAGEATLMGDMEPTLKLLLTRSLGSDSRDEVWLDEMLVSNSAKVERFQAKLRIHPPGEDGRMHPFTLIAAINDWLGIDDTVVVDGGDILSFARVALRHTADYLDCGPFGCLGVGVPFGLSSALCKPEGQTLALVGDGSIGFTAMELHTAARHKAALLTVVANNEAWNIERQDQLERYGGNLVGVDLPGVRYDQLARACGLYAERVESPLELSPALERAGRNTPSLVEVLVTRDAKSGDFLGGLASVPRYQPLGKWDVAEDGLQTGLGGNDV